ncbi:MAG: arsenosugar biosynthesis radical SAM protein ArsS [Phycisphaerales bacterium]|nr:MAG: arsenosugar biosynthesis radical SAM protein ArsS [Phycisphaerales bacterium]
MALRKNTETVPDFDQQLRTAGIESIGLDALRTLQVNLGNRCNQRCSHCHVGAGPEGDKIMPRDVMQGIVDFLGNHPGLCVDMTGGCPELNPNFRFFVENVHPLAEPLMTRTNLTVSLEPGLDWVAPLYRDHRVVVIGSLPCYTEQNVDKQRGRHVFKASMKAIKRLNELGYGCEKDLQLNLVYNPGGDFLPGPQEQLEADYKRELNEKFGVRFNRLFTMTNAPIGRFKQYLEANGLLGPYLELLADNFNPEAAENVMCRSLVSVDYRGLLYNCDFNQALGLPIILADGQAATIDRLDDVISQDVDVITGTHCYCCTAGAGSSCTGSLVE